MQVTQSLMKPAGACACGKPALHNTSAGLVCCRCYVLSGAPPADWHTLCMQTYWEMKQAAGFGEYGEPWEIAGHCNSVAESGTGARVSVTGVRYPTDAKIASRIVACLNASREAKPMEPIHITIEPPLPKPERIEKAKQPDGSLFDDLAYLCWKPGDKNINLDGYFTWEELDAIAEHVRRTELQHQWEQVDKATR